MGARGNDPKALGAGRLRWTGADESKWLGWLGLTENWREARELYARFTREVGLDVAELLSRAHRMVEATGPDVAVDDNPAARLGVALGVAAKRGRDKLTLVLSPRIHGVGAWLEQLVAESTGKKGRGILPLDRERVGPPAVYGDDRFFVHVRLEGDENEVHDDAVARLAAVGQPVVTIRVAETILQALRHSVREERRVATCLGFGPRFLHSTGQAYKGGPASGVFLQITADDRRDVPVPGRDATFGIVKAAQARGDFEVLAERRRRALRVHFGADVPEELRRLEAAVRAASKP